MNLPLEDAMDRALKKLGSQGLVIDVLRDRVAQLERENEDLTREVHDLRKKQHPTSPGDGLNEVPEVHNGEPPLDG